ncbi:hypothetical protein RhiJN_05635 [Ceratobasidium sp. AG-Ba]|nr:hypothetical protein RhiJN_05635 [Ceratobasidium sp. AG-Ba]QRW06566.1 hypothetical protein RhiLY_05565 [Ceratobasidium sp. AG-Ba]
MALTARATEPPMWDNQIVPTLRKRLENESRALSKRMSIHGAPPDDQLPPPLDRSTSDGLPSSIPRPSIQLSEQTHATEPVRTSTSTSTSRPTRPRTYSTPRPFDMPTTPAESRSNSPAVQSSPRPSRIPTRPRAGSRARLPNDVAFPPTPEQSPDLWPVSEVRTELTPPTPDAPHHPRRKRDTFVPPPASDNDEILFDEPAPFPMNTGNLGPRPSLDEYEHWYRGEGRSGGGRNGGRGEIRVATRTEMLEIASFGHRPVPPHGSGSRDGHAHGYSSELGWRTKAYDDSTVGTRSMWYGETTENVLDEAPLTDLDDVDTDSMYPPRSLDARSADSHAFTQDHRTVESYAHTAEADPEPESEPDPEPDGPAEPVTPAKRPPPSRIARATSPSIGPGASTTSFVSRPGRSPTPSKARTLPPTKPQSPKAGNASKSPGRRGTTASAASKSPSRAAGTSQATPKSPRVNPATPASKSSTPSKNATPSKNGTPSKSGTPSTRGRAQSVPKRTKKLSTSGSSGAPHPLADAIPHIPPSQTIPDDGNWDDVVLPTIARRMQEPDVVMMESKPKPKPEEEPIPPPAGSFSYYQRLEELERSKERDRRRGSGIELDEFGEWHGAKKKPDERIEERKKAPSPPPFADYTPHPPPPPEVVRQPEPRPSPTPTAQPNGVVITEADLRQTTSGKRKDDDSHSAGCCKCVVM